jgi:hypothetical protein
MMRRKKKGINFFLIDKKIDETAVDDISTGFDMQKRALAMLKHCRHSRKFKFVFGRKERKKVLLVSGHFSQFY